MPPSTVFVFEDVVVECGGLRALDGFTASVPGRGVTAVFGPSGSGKTTLLRLCNRLAVPTAGRVLFRDEDLAGVDPLRLRRRVGMVFQRPTPFPGTVADNLRVARPGASRAEMTEALAQAALGRTAGTVRRKPVRGWTGMPPRCRAAKRNACAWLAR